MTSLPPCPTPEKHTHPEEDSLGYVAWHEWAERMMRTHTQHKCPGCGRYRVYRRKAVA